MRHSSPNNSSLRITYPTLSSVKRSWSFASKISAGIQETAGNKSVDLDVPTICTSTNHSMSFDDCCNGVLVSNGMSQGIDLFDQLDCENLVVNYSNSFHWFSVRFFLTSSTYVLEILLSLHVINVSRYHL